MKAKEKEVGRLVRRVSQAVGALAATVVQVGKEATHHMRTMMAADQDVAGKCKKKPVCAPAKRQARHREGEQRKTHRETATPKARESKRAAKSSNS